MYEEKPYIRMMYGAHSREYILCTKNISLCRFSTQYYDFMYLRKLLYYNRHIPAALIDNI